MVRILGIEIPNDKKVWYGLTKIYGIGQRNVWSILEEAKVDGEKRVKQSEVVKCLVPDVAKPLLVTLHRSILEARAHPLLRVLPTGLDKTFYELANAEQLTFFPKQYFRSEVALLDHSINILAEHDLFELKNVPPAKIIQAAEAKKKFREWLFDKEYSGKFSWTLALYGTPAMAKEAQMTLREYWAQIINACFLDKKDPISEWRKIFREQNRIKQILNRLKIVKLHVEADQIDLWLTLGRQRQWVGGSGRNIPSFEIFTSPDWRGTEGSIAFNQPLYRYGNRITGIKLEFKQGKIVNASANKGSKLLLEIVARPQADRVGEFSLTDARFTRIDHFMANTLFDENMGATLGNTHIAIGSAYKNAYAGNPQRVKKKEWEKLGFNQSGEHCDMISTEDRVVTAVLADRSHKVIYKRGRFTI